VALIHFMRLSLMKGAHADLSSTAWQEIGVKPFFGLSGIPQHSLPVEQAGLIPLPTALPFLVVGKKLYRPKTAIAPIHLSCVHSGINHLQALFTGT
jgi:hypothetical protein